jgi:hypothetical protein
MPLGPKMGLQGAVAIEFPSASGDKISNTFVTNTEEDKGGDNILSKKKM